MEADLEWSYEAGKHFHKWITLMTFSGIRCFPVRTCGSQAAVSPSSDSEPGRMLEVRCHELRRALSLCPEARSFVELCPS